MPSRILKLAFTVLLLSLLIPAPAVSETPVPKTLTEDLTESKLPDFIDNRQLVLLHDGRSVLTPTGEKNVRFVSSIVTLDTSIENVRSTVTDYDNYTDFLPTLQDAEVKSTNGDTTTVNLDLILRLGVINPELDYTLKYYPGSGKDLLWERTDGDISSSYGRWEFQELSDTRTLVAYTSWSDFTNLGLAVDTVLWAQPDLKTAIPVSQSAVVMENLKDHLAHNTNPDTDQIVGKSPEIPLFAKNTIPPQITEFTEIGTPMIIHPDQQILEKSGSTLDLSFVTAIGTAKGNLNQSKELLTRFEKFPDFVEQVYSVESTRTDTGFRADWTLDMGLGLLSVGIDYSLDYRWKNKNSLVFRRTSGDLDHVYGALEWVPLQENETLFFYTTATQIGERAGYLVKLGNLIPNKQIVIGVSAGALAVEKQMKWVNDQLKDSSRP